jgi:asparagine synthase (glutamine-hydrolysing)
MSAIFGILRFDGGEVSARDLERMGNTLAHRGPDGRKFVIHDTVGLGHCLMRVNNEDMFEAQPLRDSEANLTLVADCRIDNREELAEAFGLSAANTRDMPDSAFILRAYKKWGEECAEHVIGDFAFAIWDARAKRLVLGRDHMGQRGVYYHHGDNFLAFASEIKGLWALPDVPRVLSEAMLGKMLIKDRSRARGGTLYQGIAAVPCAASLTIGANGDSALRTYWEPHADPAHHGRDETYYIEAYRSVLEEAVACRLRRLTRPAALLFSGGMDSAGIAALAGPIVRAQNRKLIAAASVCEESCRGAVRDARPAVEACRRFMPHLDVRYYVRADETVLTDLEQMFLKVDGPAGNNYVREGLFKIAAAAGARLVMNGHGGDYTVNFRGGPILGRWLRAGQFRRFIQEFRAYRRFTGESFVQTVRGEVLQSLSPLALVDFRRAVRRNFAPLWSTQPIAKGFAHRLISGGEVDLSQLHTLQKARGRWRAWCLGVLRRVSTSPYQASGVDAATHGLDLSLPFHDKRVVEFGLAIPEDMYMKNGRERHLARRALGNLLPKEVLARGRANDAQDPDFGRMAQSVIPFARDEVARLAQNPRLARIVDFEKARRLFEIATTEGDKRHHPGISTGLQAITLARFIVWFERKNR